MTRICIHCKSEMIENCNIKVESMYGHEIKIYQKGKRSLNNISVSHKAAVCPNCGYVELYIDEFNKFRK
ncbi:MULTISPECIES: hypothetical protein [Bacillaceae]|uniref:Nucleic acid-binding protein n=1 Tax=Gottfriedia luciferensis TaxID=178774 RepID=A0ABX2ZYI2_9BACI|nr:MULTISPECIES: hypothetical protein [Bacillaceae]ODG93429.1 hypothetical protein BED47_03850 [Gottfriedia luciferensis]PGZ93339.1 nucleic acid-binding protein [Bacillus sp. AFS029533]